MAKKYCETCGTKHDAGQCPMQTGSTRRSRAKGTFSEARRTGGTRGSNPNPQTTPKIAAHDSNWGRIGRAKQPDGSYLTSYRCTVCSKTTVVVGENPAKEKHEATY